MRRASIQVVEDIKGTRISLQENEIPGLISLKTKMFEVHVSPSYEQLLDFAETVARLYTATKHTSTAPKTQTERGLTILPRDIWRQPSPANG
jgi:hypothetical protein